MQQRPHKSDQAAQSAQATASPSEQHTSTADSDKAALARWLEEKKTDAPWTPEGRS
ncbi:hypothetical protein CC86DRAFT_375152 [Ophiobolus disseminans]|uniref:Uncharacterized protein n=1 Tax=Ophiobolus disseminans TaxID=1469910 RepID=A0A6A6ZE46_9PLEO|nr:hypothetical protein CC86DRAFT_375152 [Ophiobolus disseminans]